MIRAVFFSLGLASCNQVFGLDETEPVSFVDAAINCATMPGDPAFHDEDGDGYADVCDNCLGVPNQSQVDGDGDEIGDACDPQPGKRDVMVLALTFADPSTFEQWSQILGRWRIADDALISEDEANRSKQDALYTPMTWGEPIAVETRATFDSLGTQGTTSYKLGIEAITDSAGMNGFECFVDRHWDTTNTQLDEAVAQAPVSDRNDNPLIGSQLGNGATYRMLLKFDGSDVNCRVDGERGDGGSVVNDVIGYVPRLDHIGVLTEAIVGRFHYLVVYQLGV